MHIMNCIKTTIIAILLIMPAAVVAEDLWSLQELTILAFDNRNVEIEADEDDRGIRMVFNKWTAETAQEIEATLANTEIEYQLYPNRQAQMTVELFSTDASLKFNMKKQHRTIQIIVGNARPELEAVQVLMDDQTEVPLSDELTKQLKKGDLVGARTQLISTMGEDAEGKELVRSRINTVEAALRGSVAAQCPSVKKDYKNAEIRESIFLLSWCYFSMGNIEKAEKVLSDLKVGATAFEKEIKNSNRLLKRIEQKRRRILVFSILNYARAGASVLLGNTFAQFAEDFLSNFFSVNVLENISEHLIRLGLGSILAQHSDEIMAKLSNEQLKLAAPALAESYLNAGQYVRAQDTASFFLEKPLKPWAKGRLLRVRAHVHLRDGNWQDTIRDFEAANQLIEPSLYDKIALMEAYVRTGRNPLPKINFETEINTPIDAFQKQTIARLNGESNLNSNKTVSVKLLERLPDYTLYFAAKNSKSLKNDKFAKQISKALTSRKSGWAALAAIDMEIEKMKKQLATKITERKAP